MDHVPRGVAPVGAAAIRAERQAIGRQTLAGLLLQRPGPVARAVQSVQRGRRPGLGFEHGANPEAAGRVATAVIAARSRGIVGDRAQSLAAVVARVEQLDA